ncbi:MAG: hypothetical protein WB780_06845 [Candidatus Acidiferrales bacterium]
MRHWIAGACAAAVLACSAFGQQAGPRKEPPEITRGTHSLVPSTDADLNLLLEGNIRAMWIAFRDKKKDVYAGYLWDDYQAVEEDGAGERNKLHVLREVGESVVRDSEPQWFVVEKLGPEAMLVTYENVIQFARSASTRFEKIFISEIWMKRNGQWKAWRYQATRVR